MKLRALEAAILVMLFSSSCATRLRGTGVPEGTTSAPAASPEATIATPLPHPVELPPLPSQGVVVSERRGVAFLALDGRVIMHLRHFSLYYEWTVPGPVILRHQRVYFLLDAASHRLGPVGPRDAAFPFAPQFQDGLENLHVPHGAAPDSGFWAYALPSPDGTRMLEQWSGECEVPNAFIASIDGSDPRPVNGSWGLGHAAESIGLGWTVDGRAVVNLLEGLCGWGMPRPGIYLVDAPGRSELAYAFRGSARMWGTA